MNICHFVYVLRWPGRLGGRFAREIRNLVMGPQNKTVISKHIKTSVLSGCYGSRTTRQCKPTENLMTLFIITISATCLLWHRHASHIVFYALCMQVN